MSNHRNLNKFAIQYGCILHFLLAIMFFTSVQFWAHPIGRLLGAVHMQTCALPVYVPSVPCTFHNHSIQFCHVATYFFSSTPFNRQQCRQNVLWSQSVARIRCVLAVLLIHMIYITQIGLLMPQLVKFPLSEIMIISYFCIQVGRHSGAVVSASQQ